MEIVKEPFVDDLSEIDLYWLGYIQADGHLAHSDKRFYFNQKLKEPVEALALFIGAAEAKLQKSQSTFGYQEKYAITSRKVYASLFRLGSKSKLREDIYSSYDFWRGMVDGDGSISFQRSYYPQIRLCGNEHDINKFVEFIKDNLGHNSKIWFGKSIYVTGLIGTKAVELIEKLYYKEAYSALPYKRERAEKAKLYMKFKMSTSL